MTVSKLACKTILSPNCYKGRAYPVTRITVHHMAGNLTVEQCGAVFAPVSRQASSNYGIGSDGRIACYVDEDDAAWTSSSYDNDNRAITIEVANTTEGVNTGSWAISKAAWNSLVALCVDISKRYNLAPIYTGDTFGTYTEHLMFAPTGCPGPWLHARMGLLAETVGKKLGGDVVTNDDIKAIAKLTADEILNRDLPVNGQTGKVPVWQLLSWAYYYAKQVFNRKG